MAEPLVIVESFASYADAATARTLLEMSGVRAFLNNAYSADVWSGCVGQVQIEVPESDAERARSLLAEMRIARGRRDSLADATSPAREICLRCRQPLSAGSTRCDACGFTFAGEEWADYVNGPVPASLLSRIYSPIDTRRFALPPELVGTYVAWCEREGLEIRGFEVWNRSIIGHTIIDVVEEGTAAELLAAVATLVKERAADACFSVSVRRSEPGAGLATARAAQ